MRLSSARRSLGEVGLFFYTTAKLFLKYPAKATADRSANLSHLTFVFNAIIFSFEESQTCILYIL